MSDLISTRIEKNISVEISKLAKERNIGKSLLLRQVIIQGLSNFKLEFALDLYKKGKITAWKGAEIAHLSLWEFLDILKKEKIPMKYHLEDAAEDIKQVFGS